MLKTLAGQLGVSAEVRWVGRQPRSEVVTWMQASDVLCLPSLNEGIPNVVLESFACGRPVVATDVGGITEVHPGLPAGALFKPGDWQALAGALGTVLARRWDCDALWALAIPYTWARNADVVRRALFGARLWKE